MEISKRVNIRPVRLKVEGILIVNYYIYKYIYI